jgi:hypothetical protein
MTRAQWWAHGTELFGPNTDTWKFRCPICGNIASIADYRQFKDQGATPDSAATECIGRYTGGRSAFYEKEGQPCDYCTYGLFKIAEAYVDHGDGKLQGVFAFADGEHHEPA